MASAVAGAGCLCLLFLAPVSAQSNYLLYTQMGDGIPSVNGVSNGDIGPATSANSKQPAQSWIDSQGQYLYFAETNPTPNGGTNLVRKVDLSTDIVTAFAGLAFVGSSSGDGGPATDAAVNTPVGVWGNSIGVVYISAQRGHRIRAVDTSTGLISTYAGTGISCGSASARCLTNR